MQAGKCSQCGMDLRSDLSCSAPWCPSNNKNKEVDWSLPMDIRLKKLEDKVKELEDNIRDLVRTTNYCGATEKLCAAERKNKDLVSEYDNMDVRR